MTGLTIKRIEFVGFTAAGPRRRLMSSFTERDWPGWTARAEGNAVLLEGDDRLLELPRCFCQIEWGPEKPAAPRQTRAPRQPKGPPE